MVLVLDAGLRRSCMVRNLETIQELDAYVAEAGLIDVPVYSVLG